MPRVPRARLCPVEPSRSTPCPEREKKDKVQSVCEYKNLGGNKRETFKMMVKDMKATGTNLAICHLSFQDKGNRLRLQQHLPAARPKKDHGPCCTL